MKLNEPEDQLEIGATVRKQYDPSEGPFIVIGEVFWGIQSTQKPPVRKVYLYDTSADRVCVGEWYEASLTRV